MRYKVKHIMEYTLLRSAAFVVNLVPHRVSLVMTWPLAWLGYVVLRRRMRRVRRRIRQVFGHSLPRREVHRISWLAWRNLCFNTAEAMRTPSVTLDWIKKVTDYRDIHMVFDHMRDGKGVILAVPHMGNWELAGVAAQLFGAHIVIIVRRQKNPLTNAYLNRMREHAGVDAVLREGKAFSGIVRKLEEGKVLAILPDLRAKYDAVTVRFLGHEANIYGGMALFAREAGVPIIPAFVVRQGWARHRWKGFEPIWPDPTLDKEQDIKRMTQYVMDVFDQAIRRHPDQYFWFNQRWVLSDDRHK